jgi:DNA invertase Pin-like site-specific DNA recombinase
LKEVSKLSDPKRIVTLIPAKPLAERQAMKRQIRVAAYCRVSTEEEEQQSSYEAQCTYYTDKIMTNPEWTMAGIFADEGITGTSTKKRDDFNRMIRRCKAKKIDLILTKSISRFARNTLDTINYTRMLRAMGIGVIFEKENINTLDMDSEMLITMLGAFAQAESESISRNVAWGKRQAIREGKVHVNFKRLYGYVLREDGIPDIDSEKANVVRLIFERYVAGDSLRMITYRLNNAGILNPSGEPEWKSATIRSILMNEKYCGDVLGQKTFKEGVIGGKVQKNTGQLPQVLIQNNHPAIISRELFYAVQEETKRRTAAKSPSAKSPTGRSSYTSKYALSERLVCGECGTLYRRCTWNGKEQKRIVWRCVSRLDYGKKYCHASPTMDEGPLQEAIMAAVNTRMPQKVDVVTQITDALLQEAVPSRGSAMTLGEVKRRIEELTAEFDQLLEQDASGNEADRRFAEISREMAELKRQRERIAAQLRNNQEAQERVHSIKTALDQEDHHLTQWDEEMIRQLVHTVKVISADHIRVYLNDGTEIEQEVSP